tara:strand:+ start:1735 stop:2403 length:669 start_codon:yes stop_codon:yes gene_type:complete
MENLTLLIPAKFEAESLPSVLIELKKFKYKTCVILKETDTDTINSIKNFDVEVIYQNGIGYGNALIQGINQCKTKYFCIFNADGSFDPKELSSIMKQIEAKNKDFIFASRYEKNAGSDDDTLVTYIGNYIFSFIGKVFFKLEISDILYTFVVGDTSKAKSLNILSADFQFCVELPIKAKRNNFKIDTFPSFERKRIAGKKKVSAFKDGFLILKKLIELFFNK